MLARAFVVGAAAGMATAQPLIADGLPQTAPPQPMIADGTPFRHCSTGAGSCEHVQCSGAGARCAVNQQTGCAECTVTLIADGLPQTAPPQPMIADGTPFRHCSTGAGSCAHVQCSGAGASCAVNQQTGCAECTVTLIADGLPQTAPPQPMIADGTPLLCPSCSDTDCGDGLCGLDERNCAVCFEPVLDRIWSDCGKPATFTPAQVVDRSKCRQGKKCEVSSMQQCVDLKQVACDGKCVGANFWTNRAGAKMCQVCATGSTEMIHRSNGAGLAAAKDDSARKGGLGAGVIGAIAAAAGACAGGLAAAALVVLRRSGGSAEQDSSVYHSKNDGHADV